VVEERRTEVETFGAMWGPRRTSLWLIVDKHVHAEDGQRMGCEVVGRAVETFVGTDGGIKAEGTKMVNSYLGLWESLVPEVQGKRRRSSS
jgi:hypothetical protein